MQLSLLTKLWLHVNWELINVRASVLKKKKSLSVDAHLNQIINT